MLPNDKPFSISDYTWVFSIILLVFGVVALIISILPWLIFVGLILFSLSLLGFKFVDKKEH